MDITINKTSDCEATLNVTVSADEVSVIKNDIISTYTKNSRVPGFRPGKAPKSIIAKRYADSIREELEYRLKTDAQEQALNDNPELKVLDFGTCELTEQPDGSITLSSTLTTVPNFDLPEYMGIEVEVGTSDVSDAEVDEQLRKYAEASAQHLVVERPATKGDIAVIDFKTSIEGKPTAEYCGKSVGFMEGREGHWVSIGEDQFIPGLGEGLEGLSAGDAKDIPVTLKEDFPISELAGKEILFSCTVKEVREKQVPEITPELFAGTLPDKSMDEIRDLVRENLKNLKERAINEAKADQISDKLADQLSFALPAELVERENENTAQRKLYAAIQAGNYEAAKDMDNFRESCKSETERNLRVYFALQEIARREHVIATDNEMYESIASMAQQAGEKNLRSFIRKLHKENRMTGIRLSIITSKVLDLLARNAKVITKDEAAQA